MCMLNFTSPIIILFTSIYCLTACQREKVYVQYTSMCNVHFISIPPCLHGTQRGNFTVSYKVAIEVWTVYAMKTTCTWITKTMEEKYKYLNLLTLLWQAGHICPTYKESFQVCWDNSIPLFLCAAIYLEVSLFCWTSQNVFSVKQPFTNDIVCNAA